MSADAPLRSPRQQVRIRRMGLGDLDFIVQQHQEHFPDNALSRLGEGFLRRYYRTFLDGPHAAASVVLVEGQASGYAAGILDTAEHRRLIRRYHGRELAVSAAGAALLHPVRSAPLIHHRARLEVTRRLARKPSTARQEGPPVEPVAVLSHLAVISQARSQGFGASLVQDFVASCVAANAVVACVATTTGEEGAGPLYRRLGWTMQRERETFDGRGIAIYSINLREQS